MYITDSKSYLIWPIKLGVAMVTAAILDSIFLNIFFKTILYDKINTVCQIHHKAGERGNSTLSWFVNIDYTCRNDIIGNEKQSGTKFLANITPKNPGGGQKSLGYVKRGESKD